MNIALTGTKITQDTKFLAFEKNNSVDVINVIVDTDESWTYKLDVRYPDKCCTAEPLYNIINLTRTGNLCMAILTSDMLPFAGKYTMQFRGINGDKVAHSDVFDTWVKYSIEPGSTYEPVPSEFYQIEQNVTEMNNNPPYPSDDGYWMIWDVNKHEYTKSDISIKILPTIDNTTKGKYLTNNGTDAEWVDVEALPDMSSDTAGQMLTNDGKKAEWREVVNIIPDWQENNPEANDYIKNRCGGYDVVKTEQVNLSFNQPRAYSKEDGDVYFEPPQSNLSVWMAYESDVIPSPEELLSATINAVGMQTSDLKIFKPSDDFYYLNLLEVIPGTYGTNPPVMAVVTKKTTMWGYTFDKPGLYTYRAKYQGNDVAYVTSIEYVHSAYENVKIPEKYLDVENLKSLYVTITQNDDGTYNSDHTYAEIKAAIDNRKYVCAVRYNTYIPCAFFNEQAIIFHNEQVSQDKEEIQTISIWIRNDDKINVVDKAYVDAILPAFTAADNDKVLGIVNGALAWVTKA